MKIYSHPRIVQYNRTGDRYTEKGWELIPTKVKIIGEDDFIYITEFRVSTYAVWNDELKKNVIDKTPFPLGFHKSRLIKQESIQLTLF